MTTSRLFGFFRAGKHKSMMALRGQVVGTALCTKSISVGEIFGKSRSRVDQSASGSVIRPQVRQTGDSLQFVGYGMGATFTKNDATHWQERRWLARDHHVHERCGDGSKRSCVCVMFSLTAATRCSTVGPLVAALPIPLAMRSPIVTCRASRPQSWQ
jgi:hypothetical protein